MLSLIIPVYKNEEGLNSLLAALKTLAANCQTMLSKNLEVVFVIDGSPDNSCSILENSLPYQPYHAQLISLSRNFGSFSAIRAGLISAKGDSCAVMAADLQEPIELIVEFFKALESDSCDVVVGKRLKRADPIATRILSAIFWKTYKKLILADIPDGGVDIFGCSKRFRDELVTMTESHTSLIGLIYWIGFRRLEIPYNRNERKFGKSSWSLSKKLDYMLDSIFSFTDLPIKALILFGTLGVTISVVVGTLVMINRMLNWIEVPGYSALAIFITFFGGLNSLGLGIVGNYTWRVYENTKSRKLFIVSSKKIFNNGKI